jgi:SAM-dependent methyltransferase
MTFDPIAYWQMRYALTRRGSGPGSRGDYAEAKAAYVNRLIRLGRLRRVVDWGCGDGVVAAKIHAPNYTGLDVSPEALDSCRRLAADPGRSWILFDGWTPPALGRQDLALSLDVLFHLTDDALYRRHLALVFGSARFVCISAANHDETVAEHVRHRTFLDDIPAGWRIVDRPADPKKIGLYLLRRRR